MSLIPIDGNVQFVQDTTPANPANGDVWVDTSLSPSQTKIYDANASAFVQPRELSNLDAKVSNAGASLSDIESGAEDALEEDIANLSPASNSVAGNLDGGVSGGVDWASKTPRIAFNTLSSTDTDGVSVSGSGYLIGVSVNADGGDEFMNLRIDIDGTTLFDNHLHKFGFTYNGSDKSLTLPLFHRFDSSLGVGTGSALSGATWRGGALYVID